MEITCRESDVFRISTYSGNNFIDVHTLSGEMGIAVSGYPTFHYIEIREKEGAFSTFYFNSKASKKLVDLGWWSDATVVYSKNCVLHDRKK